MSTEEEKEEAYAPSENKNKYSNFLLTINTNYKPEFQSDLAEVAEQLETALYGLFTHENLRKIVSFPRGGDYSQLHDINVEFSREVGKHAQGGRVHAHAIIKIQHNSYIRLDPKAIQKIMVEQIDDTRVKNVYVNVKAFRGEQYVRDYINKDSES